MSGAGPSRDQGNLALLAELVDQVIVTLGSSGGAAFMAAVAPQQRLYRWGEFASAVGVGLLVGAGRAWAPTNAAFRSMLYTVVASFVTGAFPLAEEPARSLALPSVALFFASVACALYAARRLLLPAGGGFAVSFFEGMVPYVVVFAAMRGIARFAARGHTELMVRGAAVYIVLMPSVSKDAGWAGMAVLLTDSFACQGLVAALGTRAREHAGGGGLALAALYSLGLLAVGLLRLDQARGPQQSRLKFCKDNFCFAIAQELLAAMGALTGRGRAPAAEGQQQQGPAVCAFAAATLILAYYVRWGVGYDVACLVSIAGLSVGLTSAVSGWVATVACGFERLVLYGAIFSALQLCVDARDRFRRRAAAHANGTRPPEGATAAALVDALADVAADT